jgi:alkylation response protein AidB-like acyl-CoA dehydrogenase
MLADAARQFTHGRASPARIRACRDRVPDFDGDVWKAMADLGWLSLLVPEEDGGMAVAPAVGLGDMGQLVYEWGAAGAPEPLVPTGVLAVSVLVASDGPARKDLLAGTMAGAKLPAVAWLEQGGACGRTADGWQVSGRARFVTPADASDLLVIVDRGPLLHVPIDAPGVHVHRERRADGTAAALVTLQEVCVPERALLASAAKSDGVGERARDLALVMASVAMAGTMRSINAMTQEYLRTRVQFGKPIGSFQALQHKAVDMHIAEQLARDVAQHACVRIDAGCTPDERACLASRAKARAGDSLDRIARMAVQLHGAIGFTDEYDLSLHLNRALTMSAWLGNSEEHVRRYARHAPPFQAAEA